MVTDIVFVLVFMLLGGLLGLIVEIQKYLYPIYLALLLLIGAKFLDLLGRVITPNAET